MQRTEGIIVMTEVNEMTDVIDDKGKVAAVKSLSKMLALPSLR